MRSAALDFSLGGVRGRPEGETGLRRKKGTLRQDYRHFPLRSLQSCSGLLVLAIDSAGTGWVG